MTIPTLIHQKNVQTAETKLKKFYSTMSQATQLLQAEYGDYSNWSPSDSDDIKPWFDEYLSKVLKYTKAEYVQNHGTRFLRVYLADGSNFTFYGKNTLYFFYSLKDESGPENYNGYDSFLFTLTTSGRFDVSDGNKTMATYTTNRELLKTYCADSTDPSKYRQCIRLIQTDGWQIKPDYPYYNKIRG